MTQPIDVAYVDIVARDRSLEKLERDIDRSFKKIDKSLEKDLERIDKNFDDALAAIDKHFQETARQAEDSFEQISAAAEEAADDLETDFDGVIKKTKRRFTELGDSAEDAFDDVDKRFTSPLRAGLTKLGDLIGETGRVLGQLGGAVGGTVSSSPLLVLILALTPAIIALAAALSQLIGLVGLLPSGLGVVLAAIIPVIIAFQNFGEAVSAIADGDVEKIDEALKKLSVSAREVAKEVGAALPFLREFQRGLQESFFSSIRGAFTQLVGILPLLQGNLNRITASMGSLVKQFVDLATSPKSVATLNSLFATTANIIDRMAPSLTRFFDAIGSTVSASLPILERLANSFADALDRFSAFIDESTRTGEFTKFVEDAITTVKELVDLAKALGGLLGTLFEGTEEEGHSFIQTLTDVTTKLDKFLESAEGKQVIDALVLSVKALAATLQAMLQVFIFLSEIFRTSMKFLEDLGRGFVDLITTIGDFLAKVPEGIDKFFEDLPQKITGFINAMIDAALVALGTGIGALLFIFQELPNQILTFLGSIPQRIYDLLLQVGPIVGDAFQGAVDFGRNIIVNGFNEIVNFIMSVPDRILGLVPNFGRAGKNLIDSFMNGFRSVGSFIGDIAGDIVGAVKSFLNRAIDRINSGIATIDSFLPGDLGRIPRLASGALIKHRPGGILANVGEGREDEVVAPLSKLEDMIDGGQTITFGPNAIQVNFSGAVPTADEAREVGRAVGQGIISTIAKRDLRAQVRAM